MEGLSDTSPWLKDNGTGPSRWGLLRIETGIDVNVKEKRSKAPLLLGGPCPKLPEDCQASEGLQDTEEGCIPTVSSIDILNSVEEKGVETYFLSALTSQVHLYTMSGKYTDKEMIFC